MKEQMQKRLRELKAEFETGQKVLAELETKQINLKNSMLRISGAIQVLEELLNQEVVEEQKEEVSGVHALKSAAIG